MTITNSPPPIQPVVAGGDEKRVDNLTTVDPTSVKQLALGAGSFLGDTLGAALKGWQTYSQIGLQNKLANAQIDQELARSTPPKMGGANATPYAGQGAYYALPAGSAQNRANSWAQMLGAFSGGEAAGAAPVEWYKNYKSWILLGAVASGIYLVVR